MATALATAARSLGVDYHFRPQIRFVALSVSRTIVRLLHGAVHDQNMALELETPSRETTSSFVLQHRTAYSWTNRTGSELLQVAHPA